MDTFFKVKKAEEVFEIIALFGPGEQETVPLVASLDRVIAQDLVSREDLPQFFRSVVDGYAVRSRDTFGASESLPALLDIVGEVMMGQEAEASVGRAEAVKISTGGMMPENADGVVMVEHCRLLDDQTLEVTRSISPLENTIQSGDDFTAGQVVLKKGHTLRPQDLGALAGLGRTSVPVFQIPKVAIISTGDEVIAIDKQPRPGQVRDINRYTLGAFCRRAGADPVYMDLCPDRLEALKDQVQKGLSRADTVWISGGSSVGTRDLTLKVFETLPDFELLVHGISISPGKPTIIGKSGSKPVIGLPGHTASALVVARVFLGPLIDRLSGRVRPPVDIKNQVAAVLGRNIESAPGREDYIRVKLIKKGEVLIAEPIFGKSGLISTLVEADGLICIDLNTEGLYEGQTVQVLRDRGVS